MLILWIGCARTSLDDLNRPQSPKAPGSTNNQNTAPRDGGQTSETDSAVLFMDAGFSDAFVPDGPAPACIEACNDRKEEDPQCFSDDYDSCIDYCDEIPGWRESTQEAFYSCLESDPLCFQTLTNCILILAYPDPVPVVAKFVGTGFEQFNGKKVYARFDPGRDDSPAESQVSQGKHELVWQLAASLWALQKTIYYYVDVDGNGRCDPQVDRTQYGSLEYSGTIESPAFFGTRELQDSPNTAGQICQGFD